MRLLSFSIIILLLSSCQGSKGNQSLKNDFFNEIEEKAGTGEPIETLITTDFEWHRMYEIPDWYSEGSISEILEFEWHGASVEDQYYRLLFLDTNDNSTEYFDYYVNGGSPNLYICFEVDTLINGCQRSYITKDNCTFISNKSDNEYFNYSATSKNCK